MNRLSRIFSDNEVEFVENLKFDSAETRKLFISNLQESLKTKTPFKMKGVDSLKLKLIESEDSYLILQEKRKEQVEVIVDKELKDKVLKELKNGHEVTLHRQDTGNQLIITTNINNFIDLTLAFSKLDENIKLTYSLNLRYETDCNKIKTGLEDFLLLINSLFDVKSQNNNALKRILSFFKELYLYFYLLVGIENELGIHFEYSDSVDFKKNFNDVIELYVFLKQKRPIRDNSKADSTICDFSLKFF